MDRKARPHTGTAPHRDTGTATAAGSNTSTTALDASMNMPDAPYATTASPGAPPTAAPTA
ncbi:hypothetical protein IPZ61_06530, partial [Streptomyces sioyaensis]|nr:hypothetical protein [Streptomyces sioyaensis]